MIYDYKTNRGADRAVESVVESLRLYLKETNTPTGQWYWKRPMALWGLHDLQGAIAPYSPHRDPFGLKDMPPIVDKNSCGDALDFFLHLGREREQVQQKLTAMHEKNQKKFRNTHTDKLREVAGYEICLRRTTVILMNWPAFGWGDMKSSKLWAGSIPCGEGQGTQTIFRIGHIKLALRLLLGVELKCDHQTLRSALEHDDTLLVADVVDFKDMPSSRLQGKIAEMACQVERTPRVNVGDEGPVPAPCV